MHSTKLSEDVMEVNLKISRIEEEYFGTKEEMKNFINVEVEEQDIEIVNQRLI
jgi:hypothetical protein